MGTNPVLGFHIKPVSQSIRLVTNCLLRLTDYGVLSNLGNGVRSRDTRCQQGVWVWFLPQNCFGIRVEVLGRTLPKARLILLSEIIKTCLLNLVVEEILARAPSGCASLQEPAELFGDLGTKLDVR